MFVSGAKKCLVSKTKVLTVYSLSLAHLCLSHLGSLLRVNELDHVVNSEDRDGGLSSEL